MASVVFLTSPRSTSLKDPDFETDTDKLSSVLGLRYLATLMKC